jgi:hypothetical protein
MEGFIVFFFWYAPWILLVPLSLSWARFRHHTPVMRVVCYFLSFHFISLVLGFILAKLRVNNLPMLHVYSVIEFFLLLWFFQLMLTGFLPKKFFIVLAALFLLLAIVNVVAIEGLFVFNTYVRSVEALLIIFLSVSWFVKTLSDPGTPQASNVPYFLIIGGLLVYFSGSLVLFSFETYITPQILSWRINIWSLHTLLAVVLYLLITAALWKNRKV